MPTPSYHEKRAYHAFHSRLEAEVEHGATLPALGAAIRDALKLSDDELADNWHLVARDVAALFDRLRRLGGAR